MHIATRSARFFGLTKTAILLCHAVFGLTLAAQEHASASCDESLQAERYAAAIEFADVLLSNESVTADPERHFVVLRCRAVAYSKLGNAENSLNDFAASLDLAKRTFDPFDERLVEPLVGLGQLHMKSGEIELAEALLLRARDITHRTAGIFNVDQDVILEQLSVVFVTQGRLMQADRQQELRLRSARETFDNIDALLPALHEHARWNATLQRFPKVRASLKEAITLLEQKYGPDSPKLIQTLELQARLFRLHPSISSPRTGEKALRRIVDIYRTQESTDQADLLNAQLALGDWHVHGFKRSSANRQYQKTVKRALAENVDPTLIRQYFNQPQLVFFESEKKTFYGVDDEGNSIPSGHIKVRFNVNAKGSTRKIEVIEDTINDASVKTEIVGRIQTAIYRPRFANGTAVATLGVEQLFNIRQTGTHLEIAEIYEPVFPADVTVVGNE